MAIDPVIIDFAVRGLTDVSRAFETAEERMKRFEAQANKGADEGAKRRTRTTQNEAQDKERAYAKLTRQIEQEEQRRVRDEERISAKSVRDAEKKAKQQADSEIKELARTARAYERFEEEKLRIRRRSSEMAGQYAAREAAKEIAERERSERRFRGHFGSRVTSGLGGAISGGLALASGAMGIGGGFLLADQAHREMAAQRSAGLFINQVTSSGDAPAGATVANVLGQASMVSRETGMDKEAIIEGTRAYAKTARGGDFNGAMANMGFFAKMSQVTGVDMGEIAGAAGMLQSQNKALASDPAKMQQMLLDVLAQTKSGSLGMTELIAQAGRMSSVRGAFAGDESVNQRKLMALGQIVAPAAGAESGVMIADLALEATKGKHLGALKNMGVKFDKLDRIQSPEQMLGAILENTGGNIGKITDVLGSRGGTLLRELAGGYSHAVEDAGGGAKGKAAGAEFLKQTLSPVTGATMSADDLTKQFDQLMSTPAERFERAINKVREAIGEKLTPIIERFATHLEESEPSIEKMIDGFTQLATFIANNPFTAAFEGLGAIVAKAMLAEIASAQIAKTLQGGLSASLGGSAFNIIGASVAITGLGMMAIDLVNEMDIKNQREVIADSNEGVNTASNLFAKAHPGKNREGKSTVTPQDIAKAESELGTLKKQLDEANARAAPEPVADPSTGAILNYGGEDPKAAGQAKNFAQSVEMLTKAIEVAKRSIEGLGATAANTDPARHAPIDQRPP